jgi:hypothetical protein
MKVSRLIEKLAQLNPDKELSFTISEAHGDNHTIEDISIGDYEWEKYGYELILNMPENMTIWSDSLAAPIEKLELLAKQRVAEVFFPEEASASSYDAFMELEEDDEHEFIIWEPFEYTSIPDLQEVMENEYLATLELVKEVSALETTKNIEIIQDLIEETIVLRENLLLDIELLEKNQAVEIRKMKLKDFYQIANYETNQLAIAVRKDDKLIISILHEGFASQADYLKKKWDSQMWDKEPWEAIKKKALDEMDSILKNRETLPSIGINKDKIDFVEIKGNNVTFLTRDEVSGDSTNIISIADFFKKYNHLFHENVDYYIEKEEIRLNQLLKNSGVDCTVSIYQTDDYYEIDEEDEDNYSEEEYDIYNDAPMFEAKIEDIYGEEVEDTTTGRYCDLADVIDEIETTVRFYIEEHANAADKIAELTADKAEQIEHI